MRIAKPMLMVTTPIGVALGIYEGYQLAGGLVILMIAMLLVIATAMTTIVLTVRRERQAEAPKPAAPTP